MEEEVRKYLADASALVKLFINEEGTDAVRALLREVQFFYTTPICVVETLTVMKRKRFGGKRALAAGFSLKSFGTLLCSKKSELRLSKEEYKNATIALRASINKYVKLEPGTGLSDSNAFHEAEELSDKYNIDLSDTLQIVAMKRSAVAGATLITADRGLARAARAEGISAWNCVREPVPTTGAGESQVCGA